jgi:ABC-type nitrate/sulfonate/bicarbonate transport system ATPase subunit
MATHDTILALSRITSHFTDQNEREVPALQDISFSISTGSFTSIIGPSGAGKSTLMRTILDLIPIESGSIVRNFKRPAMVFQNYALFPWLTALENTAYGLRMSGMRKKERERIAREKLKEVGLVHLESHYPSALSGGQRQRLAIARAISGMPKYVVMDEPNSNLDELGETALINTVVALKQNGSSVIITTHRPRLINVVDMMLVLKAGKQVAFGEGCHALPDRGRSANPPPATAWGSRQCSSAPGASSPA